MLVAAIVVLVVAVIASGTETPVTTDDATLDISLGTANIMGQEYITVTYSNSHNATLSEDVKLYLRNKVIAEQSVVVLANCTAVYYYPADVGPKGRAALSYDKDGEEIFITPLCWGIEKCPPSKKPAA